MKSSRTAIWSFYILNFVRFLSIVTLLLVMASNIVTLVHDVQAVNRFFSAGNDTETHTALLDCDYIQDSTVPNQPAGVFWAVVNRLLIVGQVIVLLLSEFGWPAVFFDRFFPVLGTEFGLGALGVIQCLIGAAVLSHHVDDFTLVSAFFLFSVGCVNILLGLIFREKAKGYRSILSWKEAKKSPLPTYVPDNQVRHLPTGGSAHTASSSVSSVGKESPGFGFGRQGEKAAALQGFLISKPVESLPRYAPKPTTDD